MSQQINLYNPQLLPRKNYLPARTMAQAFGLILAGGLLLALYNGRQVAALERQVAAGKADLAARQARKLKVAQQFPPRQKDKALDVAIERAERERSALVELDDVLRRGEFGNTRGYSAYFRAFARSRVEGLWLTEVDILGAGNAIGLQGRVVSAGLLPRYIGGLANEPVLKGKSFARLELAAGKKGGPAAAPAAAPSAAAPAVAAAPAFLEFSLQASPSEARK